MWMCNNTSQLSFTVSLSAIPTYLDYCWHICRYYHISVYRYTTNLGKIIHSRKTGMGWEWKAGTGNTNRKCLRKVIMPTCRLQHDASP